MKLVDFLPKLDEYDKAGRFDRELTIYASKDPNWRPESEVILVLDPDDRILPITINGVEFDYLLEPSIAKEVLEVWQEWHGGKTPSPEEMCEAVIYYAERDAYLE
jgi:hypothetical protein